VGGGLSFVQQKGEVGCFPEPKRSTMEYNRILDYARDVLERVWKRLVVSFLPIVILVVGFFDKEN